MHLSYIARIACLMLIGWAVLQPAGEVLAWSVAPWLERISRWSTARSKERRIFWLLMAARTFPILLASCFLLPSYLSGESNHFSEEVGLAPIVVAGAVAAWWVAVIVRRLVAIERTRRSLARCSAVGETRSGLPILLYPGERPVLALAGVFSPKILLSRALMDSSWCSSDALHVALEHEVAHARHRDNWKQLLGSLPHITIATKKRPSLEQRWRLAAELASDEESVHGDLHRSLLLAEMLVFMAKGSQEKLPTASIAFLSRADDLRIRVDRLLQIPGTISAGEIADQSSWVLPMVMISLGLLGYLCTYFGHGFAELIFRFK